MLRSPHRRRVAFNSGDTMVTKQSHKDECDIHRILRQYQRTGILAHVQTARPQYIDLPDPIDYQTAMNTMIQAQDAFAALPSAVRDYFANDPARFLAAFEDKAQADKLREFGLLQPKPPEPASGPSEGA